MTARTCSLTWLWHFVVKYFQKPLGRATRRGRMSGHRCSHPARTALRSALRSAVGACVDVGAPRAWCATLLKHLGPGSENISTPRPTTTQSAPPAAGVAVRFQFLLVLRGHSRIWPEVNHTAEPFGFTIPGVIAFWVRAVV